MFLLVPAHRVVLDKGLYVCVYLCVVQKDEVYLNLVLEFVPETVYRVARHHSKSKQVMLPIYIKVSSDAGSLTHSLACLSVSLTVCLSVCLSVCLLKQLKVVSDKQCHTISQRF